MLMRRLPPEHTASSGKEAGCLGYWKGARVIGSHSDLQSLSSSIQLLRTGDAEGQKAVTGINEMYFSEKLPTNVTEDKKHLAKPDLSVPPFDRRREASGMFAVVWLVDGDVIFSSRCRDLGHALRLARQHKRSPTWVVNGFERELDTAELCLSYRTSRWLTPTHMDSEVRHVIHVVATTNLPEASHYVRPKKSREPQETSTSVAVSSLLELAAEKIVASGGLFNRLQWVQPKIRPDTFYDLLHIVWTQLRRENPGSYPDRAIDELRSYDTEAAKVAQDKFLARHEDELSVNPDWAKWIPWVGQQLDKEERVSSGGTLLSSFPQFVAYMRKEKPDVNKLNLWRVLQNLPRLDKVPQGEEVYRMSDGWTVQKLTTKEQLDAEGEILDHCVGSYFNEVNDGNTSIYSLRDPEGFPHVTMEYKKHHVTQIQAKGNDFPKKHVQRLIDVVNHVFGGDPLGLLKLGVDAKTLNLESADLSGTDLQGADLYEANLYEANLQGANLYGADLRMANLRWANLQSANLRWANLHGANLQSANLQRADLYGAILFGAILWKADLKGANLYGANLHGANLQSADLRGALVQLTDFSDVEYDSKTRWPEGFTPPPLPEK